MRSRELDMDFWEHYCKEIYGDEMYDPAVNEMNAFFGGLDIRGENIYFMNGSEDPWQHAAMTQLKHPDTF